MKLVFSLIALLLLAAQGVSGNIIDKSTLKNASIDHSQLESFVSLKNKVLSEESWIESCHRASVAKESATNGNICSSKSSLLLPIYLNVKNLPYLKTIGMTEVTIISPQHKGFSVYVDDQLIAIEGNSEPLDGQITVEVQGGLYHSIKIVKGDYISHTENDVFFEMDKSYTISDINGVLK